MARPKTVSVKTVTTRWGVGWNPAAKVAWHDGIRRHWKVTRLAACVHLAKAAQEKGFQPEITFKYNGYEYVVTGWER